MSPNSFKNDTDNAISHISALIEDGMFSLRAVFDQASKLNVVCRCEFLEEVQRLIQRAEITGVRIYTDLNEQYVFKDFVAECEDGVAYVVENLDIEKDFLCVVEHERSRLPVPAFRKDWKLYGKSRFNVVDADHCHDGVPYMVLGLSQPQQHRVERAKSRKFKRSIDLIQFVKPNQTARIASTVTCIAMLLIVGALAWSTVVHYMSLVRTEITTNEPAEIHVFPLDDYFNPILEKGFKARTPFVGNLKPGSYWISAIADDGEWIEVLRRVPEKGQTAFMYSSVGHDVVEGVVELPMIKVVSPRCENTSTVGNAIIGNDLREGAMIDQALEQLEKEGFRLPTLQDLEGVDVKRELSITGTGLFADEPFIGRGHVFVIAGTTATVNRFAINPGIKFRAARSLSPLRSSN